MGGPWWWPGIMLLGNNEWPGIHGVINFYTPPYRECKWLLLVWNQVKDREKEIIIKTGGRKKRGKKITEGR